MELSLSCVLRSEGTRGSSESAHVQELDRPTPQLLRLCPTSEDAVTPALCVSHDSVCVCVSVCVCILGQTENKKKKIYHLGDFLFPHRLMSTPH